MKNKCKCREKNAYTIIEGIGIRCTKCFKWIAKIRSRFYRQVAIKQSNKKYNRKREKQRINKEIREN